MGIFEREKFVFNVIVDYYFIVGDIIGFRILVKKYGIEFLFVIICNVMVDLEDMGFIEKIYILLGCILIDMGYKYYLIEFLKVEKII